MCGLAGIFHLSTPKPVEASRITTMTDAMLHRGPDGGGVWTERGVGLGHRRLSVIDLEGSPQPMASADGKAMLIFNGEIYNFQELRRELAQDGVQFRTEGDSEVILAAYQRWGIDCLEKLHGMFVFAIYDLHKKALLIARDRLGVKPLYLSELSDGSLAFASEMKGLLAHPLLRKRIDPLAVEDYMTWGYVPDHRSFLQGIKKLPAGHFLWLEHGKPMPQPRQWWDISFAERTTAKQPEQEAELLHLMQQAVTSRMTADVPLGAFLSGGVDSSSVVALMSEASRDPVRSCSIGFDAADLDETTYAQKIAELYGTDHRERKVGSDDFEHIDLLAMMFDEPFADGSALPTWRVCQLAREEVTVALSGDGADEAFAGYRRQVFHAREEQARAVLPGFLRKPLFGTLGKWYPKLDWAPRPLRFKSTFQSLGSDGAEGYARALCQTPPELRDFLFSEELKKQRGDYRAEEPIMDLMRNAPARSGLDQAQYADLKFWLPGDILTKVDRTSMAVSLEAREPLLDHRLIEFAATLPESSRIKGTQGKYLLKKTMERYLPEDILYRPKMGFVTPIAQWLRGPLADQARGIAKGGRLARTGWFNSGTLSQIADDHIAGRSDHGRLLWQLLMLDQSMKHIGID